MPPVYQHSLLEFRVALDAASAWLFAESPTRLLGAPGSQREQTLPRLSYAENPPWRSGLWLDPQREDWETVLGSISHDLPSGGRLAVLLSLPLSRRLPGRSSQGDQPLGLERHGPEEFRAGLDKNGFRLQDIFGLHTGQAILLNQLALTARRLGLLAFGDRLEFAARKHYIKPWKSAWSATCLLLRSVKA